MTPNRSGKGGAAPGRFVAHFRNLRNLALWCCCLWGITSCTLANVQVNVVGERTALENQVLGTYNALDQEMLLVASVRGVDPMGQIAAPPPRSPEHQDALMAMQTLAFHADDVERFKGLGWVGENNEGFLTTFYTRGRQEDPVPDALAAFAARYGEEEFNSVVEQVNAARDVLMLRVIHLNENFSQDDLPEIRKVFGKLNAERALPGERVQTGEGAWIRKE